ncbi:hypothetical protein ANCDUO_15339 [Ancylostoma duodenale]|uniref:Uncharacterized protein n=1 Tax=Ancylostoma duodenale TaxID=51022 RepID=A0A0C2G6G9_9BILA|nr:hypothetical protein ANCDUO_15339 [Ancylostoma duodenale]
MAALLVAKLFIPLLMVSLLFSALRNAVSYRKK